MSAAEHDLAVAQTSHLPHVVAAALAKLLPESYHQFAASGFRDTTRIASGHPELWVGILLANADGVIRHLDAFTAELAEFRACIQNGDAAALENLLEVAKTNRDALH